MTVRGHSHRNNAIQQFPANRVSGAKTVLGTLDDTNLIEQLAAQSDVVFHTATSDHLASAQAILRGIAKRASQGMHTSTSDITGKLQS